MYARGDPTAVITRETLAAVFEIEVAVIETEHGMQVVPLEPLHDGDPA